jgi:hypothetical protein
MIVMIQLVVMLIKKELKRVFRCKTLNIRHFRQR